MSNVAQYLQILSSDVPRTWYIPIQQFPQTRQFIPERRLSKNVCQMEKYLAAISKGLQTCLGIKLDLKAYELCFPFTILPAIRGTNGSFLVLVPSVDLRAYKFDWLQLVNYQRKFPSLLCLILMMTPSELELTSLLETHSKANFKSEIQPLLFEKMHHMAYVLVFHGYNGLLTDPQVMTSLLIEYAKDGTLIDSVFGKPNLCSTLYVSRSIPSKQFASHVLKLLASVAIYKCNNTFHLSN
ncbi:hypothetical protein L218DRAFT_951167 [Marasmius fiardii PR-910]|nr:hypothetical protein L218DRAFT_951167 [Marasmius fiardii PR-910]